MSIKKRNTMNSERELWVMAALAVFGTVMGILIEYSAKETSRSWKQICANGVLNGVFTVGMFYALRWAVPDMAIEFAVGISAMLSSVGRGAIVRIVNAWVER